MTDVEVIEGVIDLLAVQEHWAKFTVASTRPGTTDIASAWKYQTSPLHAKAKSWCLGGAVMKVTGSGEWYESRPSVFARFDRMAKERGYHHFADFNNAFETDHGTLMVFLKQAAVDAKLAALGG